jgi:predicted CXXCH cytochrome family protein
MAGISLGAAQSTAGIDDPTDWTACLACHAPAEVGLPALTELRPAAGGSTAETDCRKCHQRSELETLRASWTHPVRPVAEHLQCVDCHIAAPHDAQHPPPLPRGDYKPQACYSCHKQVDVARHWPSRHSAGIACRDCHPAHEPFQAGLPAALIPASARRGVTRAYDWQQSNELCLKCHSAPELTLRLDSGFVVLNTVNYHEAHLARGQSLCIECHEPHGSTRPALLRQRLLDGEAFSFMPRPNGGSCATNCHGVAHVDWEYRNALP